jgi:hypothetical protein
MRTLFGLACIIEIWEMNGEQRTLLYTPSRPA